jgi:hypothetical protein
MLCPEDNMANIVFTWRMLFIRFLRNNVDEYSQWAIFVSVHKYAGATTIVGVILTLAMVSLTGIESLQILFRDVIDNSPDTRAGIILHNVSNPASAAFGISRESEPETWEKG